MSEMSKQSEADRFLAACKALRVSRGGRPVASIDPVTGRLICTYPDGTVVGNGAVSTDGAR